MTVHPESETEQDRYYRWKFEIQRLSGNPDISLAEFNAFFYDWIQPLYTERNVLQSELGRVKQALHMLMAMVES